ncbi:anti-sigma factor antagonist [Desulfomarina profundi]|uniref:Anti-sigma factor antagonist n=1 Tax=Desulfomarina profundi TaxID=2772557 RepID=A0A8D5FTY3_9BACT|nr:STAS domain-containing protein [Desulfomarina profundi]BCL59837.1 anti-sigma factor antagonist [Desulfomarina profundi]
METEISRMDNATIFDLKGRLDSRTAPQFEKQVQDFLHSPDCHLVLNFNELDYISSAGLRIILNTAKAYKSSPYCFVTCCMQDHVQEVFEISGFDSFITIYQNLDDSLEQLRASS